MEKGPEAGWYPNPEAAHEVRWWDGEQWTAHTERNPMAPTTPSAQTTPSAPPPPSGTPSGPSGGGPSTDSSQLRPLAEWFNETFALLRSRGGHLFTLALVLGLLPNLLYAMALYTGLQDMQITILPGDQGLEGSAGSGLGGTGVESSEILLIGVATIISQLLGTVMWIAFCRQVQLARVDQPEIWSDSLWPSFKRMHRVLGVQLVILGLLIGAPLIILAAGALIHGAVILLSFPVLLLGLLFLGPRLALALGSASLAPQGLWSVSNAFVLIRNRFGAVAGRILLLALVGFFGSMMLSSLGQMAGSQQSFLMTEAIETIDFQLFFGDNPALFFLAGVLGGLGNSLFGGLMAAGMVVLYGDLGGKVANDLSQPSNTSEPSNPSPFDE